MASLARFWPLLQAWPNGWLASAANPTMSGQDRRAGMPLAGDERRGKLVAKTGGHMLKWALIFFVISVVAGLLGFTGIASGAAGIAKILFYIAIAILLILVVAGLLTGSLVF